MESSEVCAIISYEKPGTQPPVYVAGTFSDPPWKPHEMAYTTNDDGEHVFTKEFAAEPGTRVQYKFRIGTGDWWVLHDDVPTVKDSNGNENHELVVSQPRGLSNSSSSTSVPNRGRNNEDSNGDAVSPKTLKPGGRGLPPPLEKGEEGTKPAPTPYAGASTPTYANVAAEVKLDKGELPVIGTSEGVFDNHRLPPVEKAVESTPPGLTLCIDSNTPTYSSVAAEAKFSKAELPPIDTPEGVAKHILASHSRASTPTYASVAAEVADSATFLNEEKPETPIPDELAGEIGYRRLSSTPIAEVANTAAEVADTAQRLDDPEEVVGFHIIPIRDDPSQRDCFQDDGDDEAADDKSPLFSHECIGMHGVDETRRESKTAENGYYDLDSSQVAKDDSDMNGIDLDDPTLEPFPSNREDIINEVRKIETGLDEDQALFEGAPLSPVIGPASRRATEDPVSDLLLSPIPVSPVLPRVVRRSETSKSPRSSAISAHSSTASLQAIAESEEVNELGPRSSPVVFWSTPKMPSSPEPSSSDEKEGVVVKENVKTGKTEGEDTGLPTPNATPSPDQSAPQTPPRKTHNDDKTTTKDANDDLNEPAQKVGTASTNVNQNESPRIVIETAEQVETAAKKPDRQESASGSNGFLEGSSASGAVLGIDSGQLRKRVVEDEDDDATSETGLLPASRPPERRGNWFTAFFRLIFVDWIGGFISKLCGGRRKTLLTTGTAVLFMAVGWWKMTGPEGL